MSDWKKKIGGQSTELKDNLCDLSVTLVRSSTRNNHVFRRMEGEMEMFNLQTVLSLYHWIYLSPRFHNFNSSSKWYRTRCFYINKLKNHTDCERESTSFHVGHWFHLQAGSLILPYELNLLICWIDKYCQLVRILFPLKDYFRAREIMHTHTYILYRCLPNRDMSRIDPN